MTIQQQYFNAKGTTLIEVLVTIVIMAVGLLGLAGLQMRLQMSEIESYQRAHALMLLNDIASRIEANSRNAPSYTTTSPLGAGMNCPTTNNTSSRAQIDLAEWCRTLQGAGETIGTATATINVGAMIGGRGCIEDLTGGDYLVTIAWQGMTPLSGPPVSVGCGLNLYNTAGSNCVDDRCRRAITTILRLGALN